MTIFNVSLPVGSDAVTPIQNPEGRMAIYALSELWNNTIGTKRFIPNIGDLVADRENITDSNWWIVTGLDINYVPQLKRWGNTVTNTVDTQDILTGPGRTTHNQTYRAYYNKDVTPHTLVVENRLSFKGTVSRYAKIMRQVDGPTNLKVISAYYDNSGNLLGQDIPLQLVGADPGATRSEYCVPGCYTMEDLPAGEIISVHAYTEDGHPSSITSVMVEPTSAAPPRNTFTKYITGVELLSPFMSDAETGLVALPINIPLSGLYLRGRVHFSDGSFKEYPVDGTRFDLLGMESYVDSMVDQNLPVWLQYYPLVDETFYGNVNNRFYNIRTMEAKGMYNVRLYCFPVWTGAVTGYTLRWFMYSSERNVRYDVTDKIQYTVNTPAFQSTLYGVNQALSVSVNLKDVNPLYENVRQAQVVQVVLWRQGTERSTNWTVVLEQGQDPAYGINTFGELEFINQNLYKLSLRSGCTTQQQWLDKVYTAMRPVVNPIAENKAPNPTHFRIRVSPTFTVEKSISQWNETLSILAGLKVGDNVYIEWLFKTPETDLELGTSGMLLWSNNNVPL